MTKNKFSKVLLYGLCITFAGVLMVVIQGYSNKQMKHPKPTEETEEMEEAKRNYIEQRHRAAPGTNWRQVEENNAWNTYAEIQARLSAKTTSTFAGGAFSGTWYERGNDNQAGRMDAFAYLPGTNTLYGSSDGGSVWKTSLPTVAWSKVSDVASFQPYVLGAIQRGSGSRLFLSAGLKIWRTDNEGATFDTSTTGISFPVGWGGNRIFRVIPVNDATHTIYCVTFEWDDISWSAGFSLYSSTDSGITYHHIRKFPYHNDNQLSFATPLGSGTLYALGVSDAASDTLFSITNSVVSVASVTNSFSPAANLATMKCMTYGSTTHFYAMVGGTNVFHSVNFGNTWMFKSTVTEDDSYVIGVSSKNPNMVLYGNVDGYRSTDSGANWTIINPWGDYYGAPATKLHADIRAFDFFQYASGVEFGIIGTDGGAFITNDVAATVNNISLTGLHVNQLWDHITNPADVNMIFAGAQDQGLQHTNSASGTGFINEEQVISGDYGQLRITGGGNTLWPEYPGGNMYLYNTLSSPAYIGEWDMTGTDKPEAGWMLPTSNYYTSATQDEILIGGGNITGDSGSYLVRLTLSMSGGFSVTPFQYPYNFQANSNNGTSGISAIAISNLSNTLMYVAAEDGTFFYSTDAGSSWSKTAGFPGVAGMWLYGASIVASADSVNTVYFAGSGYSNPPVYVSRNHGVSFTSMSSGLPPTLVNNMAILGNDSLIFAATEAGPYVYVAHTNHWYSLADGTTPKQNWRSVEYLPSINTVRFGTYGRGIWDLKLNGNPIIPSRVQNPVSSAEIKVGPNPVKSGAPITLFSKDDQSAHLVIYTMEGKMVADKQVATNTNIAMPALAAGVYMYSCKVATGGIQNGMLVVGM